MRTLNGFQVPRVPLSDCPKLADPVIEAYRPSTCCMCKYAEFGVPMTAVFAMSSLWALRLASVLRIVDAKDWLKQSSSFQ